MAVLLRLKQTVRTLLLLDRNMRTVFPIYDGAHQSVDKAVLDSECVNLQAYSPIATGAASRTSLVPTPGLTTFLTGSISPFVGYVFKNELYVILRGFPDDYLYKIDKNGAETLIGSLGSSVRTSRNFPQFASNGELLYILFPEDSGYFYDPDTGLSQNVDVVYQGYEAEDTGVISVTSGDGYFIFCTTKTVFNSGLVTDVDKGKSFDALDFASAEYSDDDNVRVAWLKGELRIFGSATMETWANVGGTDFPFQRIDGATIEKGLKYPNTLQEVDNSFVWVGSGKNESLAVWRATGGGGTQKLSNEYVDALLINTTLDADDAYDSQGFAYSYDGNTVYGFSIAIQDSVFTQSDATLCTDLSEGARVGRMSWRQNYTADSQNPSLKIIPYSAWSVGNCVICYNRVIFNGRYELNSSVFSEKDAKVFRRFTSSYLQAEGDDVYVSRVELRMKNAVGEATASDDIDRNPTVLMEVSDDQGRTWKDFGSRNIGRAVNTRTQVVWNRGCGRSPNYRLFRFTTNNSVEMVFLDLVLDIERASH